MFEIDRTLRSAAALALWLIIGSPVVGLAQDADRAPQFRSRVELVRLQVRAHQDGEFVAGLRSDDFVLSVNGEPRELAWVTETDLSSETIDSTQPAAAASASVPRHFVFVLDALFQRPEKLEICKRAVAEFLETMHRPGDLVALAAIGYRGVSLLTPFTAEPDVVAERLDWIGPDWTWQINRGQIGSSFDHFGGRPHFPVSPRRPRGVPAGFELLPDLLPDHNLDIVNMVGLYLSGMNELAVALQAVEGRKHILLYSRGLSSRLIGLAGMPSVSPRAPEPILSAVADLEYTGYDLRQLFFMMAESMRDADAAVHSMSTARAPSSRRGNRFGDALPLVSHGRDTGLHVVPHPSPREGNREG